VVGRRWMLRTLAGCDQRPVHERREKARGEKKKRPATELLAACELRRSRAEARPTALYLPGVRTNL
jgi:hypothetical protein